MSYIIYSTASIALIYVVAYVYQKKEVNYKVVAFAAFLMFMFSWCMNAKADEYQCHFPFELYKVELTTKELFYYEDLCWTHMNKIEECMQEAQEIVPLLPCTNDKEKANYLFRVVLAGFVPATPSIKIISMGSAFLLDYIPACIDDWHRLVYLIEKAKYHTEMAIFFNNLLIHKFGERQF